jgi:hypothetical protein
MPNYDHLRLVRLPEQMERRRRGGGGVGAPTRDPGGHSGKLRTELDTVIAEQQRRRPPEFVDPSLILRVRMNGMTLEEDWERLGLTVLSTDEDKTLILFSSSDDLQGFRERLEAYSRGAPPGQAAPSYSGFIGRVEEIGAVEPATASVCACAKRALVNLRISQMGEPSSSTWSCGISGGVMSGSAN